MSIAVAVQRDKTIALATDSVTSFGSLQLDADNHQTQKVVECGNALIAGTGWAKYEAILRDHIGRNKRAPKLSDEASVFKFFHGLWDELQKRYSFVNEQCDDKDSPFGDLDSSFLVVSPTGMFYVASDMSVTSFSKFFAIGSGQEYALGACHTLDRSRQGAAKIATSAAEAACAFDVYCSGKINVREIKVK